MEHQSIGMELRTPFAFSYVENCASKKCLPAPCSKEDFERVINSKAVSDICKQISDGKREGRLSHDGIAALKRQLPAFCFLAHDFGGKERRVENAVPSGLAFLDLDHIGDAKAVWERVADKVKENGCVLAHITPSGEGLRLVFLRPEGKSVAEAMQWFAERIGVQKYDTSVKDLSRVSFAVPATYILYRDDERLFDSLTPLTPSPKGEGEQITPSGNEHRERVLSTPPPIMGRGMGGEAFPYSYRNIPYTSIITALLEGEGFELKDGKPIQGERHNALKTLLPKLRHICDFDRDFILAVLPDWGLPKGEVLSLVESSVKYEKGKSAMPRKLSDVINRLTREQEQAEHPEQEQEESLGLPLPAKLPSIVNRVLKAFPVHYRPAALISTLPVLGTLATRVRCYYGDELHSLSFFSCITSPQAGGKGAIKRLADMLLTPLQMYDDIEEQKLIEYEAAKENAKNKKEQPEDPHPCLRIIPEKTSNTSLSQLLDNARGQHLILVTPEIDSLAKNNKAVWSSMDDILRKAFDNDRIGQHYMSNQSHKSRAEAYINLMMTGTPSAMRRFFSNVEGGLNSRVAFAQLPSTYGKGRQQMGHFSERDIAVIQQSLEELMREGESAEYAKECGATLVPRMKTQLGEDGKPTKVVDNDKVPTFVYRLPKLEQAIDRWQDDRVSECRKEINIALDTFRRRAAVIGFRAGVLYYIWNGHRLSNEVIALALWTADYVLDQQLALFGGDLNEAHEKNLEAARKSDARISRHKPFLYDALPEVITMQILQDVCRSRGESTNIGTLRSILSRWVTVDMLRKTGDNEWRKPGKDGWKKPDHAA